MAPRAVTSSDDVFINCPFDKLYDPTFRALIFTLYACGFRPRSARELDDGAQTRLEKLYGIIGECRYGVHDLCRTEPDPLSGLPRFNMPLELGIFLGAKRFGSAEQKAKRALVLDVDRFRYQQFVSDLAGADIHEHSGDPIKAMRKTRDWLANVSRRALPSADKLQRLYGKFLGDLAGLATELEFDEANIPYVDFERFVTGWLVSDAAA